MITHWDEVDGVRRERGHIAASWQPLSGAHSVTAGVQGIPLHLGGWATPLHLEGSEEEIFFVLSGTGVSVQWDGEKEEAFPVGTGDCLVHLALEHAHTIVAGDEGLVVLAFGQRHYAANTLSSAGRRLVARSDLAAQGAPDDHPWTREAAVGPPDVGGAGGAAAAHRQRCRRRRVRTRRVDRRPCLPPARQRSGLGAHRSRAFRRSARAADESPHVHSAEEEIFVVLDGSGTLLVYPSPRVGGEIEEYPVRAGCTIAQPAGTPAGACDHAQERRALTLLAFGDA